jgi:pimeloyl-ACP methyl ester carboxylesterase
VGHGRGHRPGRGRDALFCTEIIGVPAEHLEPMKAMPMWPLMEAGAATPVYDAAVMDGCQDGTGLAAEVVDDLRAITVPVLVMNGASASTMPTGADAIAVRLSNGQRRTLDGQTHEADPVTLSAALIAHFAA